MSDPKDVRARSRATVKSAGLTWEVVNAGSLQRIADATEKMAESYDSMRNDRDFWKRIAESRLTERDALQRQVNALRGVITKMKRRQG